MHAVIEEKVEKVKEVISTDVLESMTRPLRLSDLIREGSQVTEQAIGSWGDGESACAMSAAVIAAKARGIL